jgi:hypothetical protein
MIKLKNLLKEDEAMADKGLLDVYNCLVKNPDVTKQWIQTSSNFKTKSAQEPTILLYSKTIEQWSQDKKLIDLDDMALKLKLSVVKKNELFQTLTCKIKGETFHRDHSIDSMAGGAAYGEHIKKEESFTANNCAELLKKIDAFINQFEKYRK